MLVYGEDPQDIQFTGRMRGLPPDRARYFWTFEGGEPARFPAHGTSARIRPSVVRFSKGGLVCLHVVDRKDTNRVLATAKLPVAHVAFEFQPQEGGTPEEPVLNYIPVGAVPGPKHELRVCADVLVTTTPPLPGIDLGYLKLEPKSKDRIAPSRVITDARGTFLTTLSGSLEDDKDSAWSSISLELVQRTRDPALLDRLRRRNEWIRHRHDPWKAEFTAVATEVYEIGEEKGGGAPIGQVERSDAFELRLPAWLKRHQLSYWGHDPSAGCVHLALTDLRRPGREQIAYCFYPVSVREGLGSSPDPETSGSSLLRPEDGRYYVRVPDTRRPIYRVGAGEFLRAVTIRPRNGQLAVLVHGPANGFVIRELDSNTGIIGKSVQIAGEADCDELYWLSDRYLVGTIRTKRCTAYMIIDLAEKRVAAYSLGSDFRAFLLREGKALGITAATISEALDSRD